MNTVMDLPENLPKPIDDGGCNHLQKTPLPSVALPATDGSSIDFSTLDGCSVIYFYPLTGRPGNTLPDGWNDIPGARGCTPQSCSFRDHHAELKALNTSVYGLSTQSTEYQKEAVNRLHLPFALVSDQHLAFIHALQIPTFEFEGKVLSKRLTLIINNGVIEKVFYPVFPPDKNAGDVIAYLRERSLQNENTNI